MTDLAKTPATRKFFEEQGKEITFSKNEIFVRSDDPRPWVYYLKEGLVAASFTFNNATDCILGYFVPSNVFAQNKSFYEDDGGSLDFTSIGNSIVYRVHRDSFQEQLYSDWDFNREYTNNTLLFRIFTTDRAICLAEQRIHNRCIRWLMLVAKYYSEPDDKGLHIIMPLTQSTIAKFLNISRESVSKVLHSLIKDGHIELNNKQLYIMKNTDLQSLLED